MSSSASACLIAVKYLLVATTWVLFSDYLLTWVVLEPELQLQLQTFKGMAFVLITTAVLFFTARHQLRGR